MVTRLPDPPRALPADPPSRDWQPDHALLRVYHEHPLRTPIQPRTFGPLARFDPHVRDRRQQPREAPDARGVIYLADSLTTALAEAYPDQMPDVGICARSRAVWLETEEPVSLLDITGDGAMAIGAVGTLQWGDEPRRRTQRWGRRIYEQYDHLAGIHYAGAHQGGRCVALWERGAAGLRIRDGADQALWAIWSRIIVAFAGQGRRPRHKPDVACAGCRDAYPTDC